VKDKTTENPMMVFVGDVLFAGEVGRVDFFGKEKYPKPQVCSMRACTKKSYP
jgi:hypothetical protein